MAGRSWVRKRTSRRLGAALAVMLMAAAVPASAGASPGALDILIAHGDLDYPPNNLESQLLATPGVHSVTLFDAASGTPSAASLAASDLVVTWSFNPYSDPAVLGDRLADYIDAGGHVFISGLAHVEDYAPSGRFASGEYAPFNTGLSVDVNWWAWPSLAEYDTASSLMQGVTALSAPFPSAVNPAAGATEVARWSDRLVAIAVKNRVVGFNAYIGEWAGSQSATGDLARLIVNAASAGAALPTTCSMTAVRKGPPAQGDVTVVAPAGLQAITDVKVDNAAISVQTFPEGTTAPVIVTATKSTEGSPGRFSFNALDLAGKSTFCA
jgi:hypothetical protein